MAPGPRQRPSEQPGTTTGIGTEQVASSPRRRARQAHSLAAWLGPRRGEQAAGLGLGARRRSRASLCGNPSPQGAVISSCGARDHRSWTPRIGAESWKDAPGAANERRQRGSVAASPGDCGWLLASPVGTVCGAQGPTPIPAGRKLPCSQSLRVACVFKADARRDSATPAPETCAPRFQTWL